jgi:hypothetical protein
MKLCSLLLIGSAWLISGNAVGQTLEKRPEITGFGKMRFGMTVKEVARITKLNSNIPLNSNIHNLVEPVKISGKDFLINLTFSNNKLETIALSYRETLENNQLPSSYLCRITFDDFLALIQAKYGRPDFEPQEFKIEKIQEFSTTFTDANGNQIIVGKNTYDDQPNDCNVNITYQANFGGNPF